MTDLGGGGKSPVRALAGGVTSRFWLLPFAVAAFGVAAITIIDAWHAPPTRLVDSFDDDAYYYFEIARNIAQGRGSTFDGLELTNGYHPLWLLLLVPVFAVVDEPLAALVAVKVLVSLLFCASILIVAVWARRHQLETEATLALPFLVFQRDFWLSGMETGLLLPLLFLAMSWATRQKVFETPAQASLGMTGLFLGLALLARLDLIFLVALAGGLVFLIGKGHLPARLVPALRLTAPALVLLALFLAINLMIFGEAMPVSGQAKALGGPFWNPQVVSDYLMARPVLFPGLDRIPVWAFWLLVILPALIVAWQSRKTAKVRLGELLLLLAVAQIAQLGYYVVSSSWQLWRWYYYYLPPLFFLSAIVLANLLVGRLGQRARLLILLAMAALIAVKLERSLSFSLHRTPAPDWNYKTAALQVSDWLETHTQEHDRVAMGDRAGVLSYLLERPLLQIEGLVNSGAFLDALEAGKVEGFLRERSVDFIIYSGGPKSGGDPRLLPGTTCAELIEPKWGRGPKFTTVICQEDLVFEVVLGTPGPMGGRTSVWRFEPGSGRPKR